MFEDAGFHDKLRAIPEDSEGIDIEYLRQQIKKSEDKAKVDANDLPVSSDGKLEEASIQFSIPHGQLVYLSRQL
jgi:hypothetical protein